MNWLIDELMCERYYGGNFYESLINLNRNVQKVKFNPIVDRDIEVKDFSLVYGSIEFINIACKNNNVMAFSSFKQSDYNYLLSTFDKSFLLSDSAIIVPYNYLFTHQSMLCELFGENVFIRSNSSKKVLTGQVINLNDLSLLSSIGKRCDPETLIVIDNEKRIKEEYRIFYSRHSGPLTGSTYNHDRVLSKRLDASHGACEFVQKAYRTIDFDRFDDIIVIDVALTSDNEYKIIECNSPSTSGLYSCDAMPIIQEMERIVTVELNDSQHI